MIEVMSGEVITIDNVDVEIPYADEDRLTNNQLRWLKSRGIKLTILSERRKTFWAHEEFKDGLLCNC